MPFRIIAALCATLAVSGGAFVFAANIGTTVLTTESQIILAQRDFRWYANGDVLTPTSSLAGENTATTTPGIGTVIRLRMNVNDASEALPTGSVFLLQYANVTSGPWTSLSTSTAWIFFDNPSVADGQSIVTTLLSSSDVGESYGESNPSAATPSAVNPGQEGEWDWVLSNNSATTSAAWYFRMIFSSGTVLSSYERFPSFTATVAPPPPPPPPPPPGSGTVTGGGGIPGFLTPGPKPSSGLGIYIPERPDVPSPCDLLIVQRIDLSGDCRVDIVDLSILVYYYGRRDPAIVRYDLNNDALIDLIDISVLMFYWTT